MTANETLDLISKQWCSLDDLMKLGQFGRNSALKVKREIKNKLTNQGYKIPNHLIPMKEVVDYFRNIRLAQQVFPKLRTYCDKYNVTFLVTHHLNKNGKTLGSIALDATIDGRITLIGNKANKKYIKLQTINRDFPVLDIQLKKLDNLIFKKINSIEEDELSYEMTSFIKYVASQKDIDFTCTDIVLKANIPMSPKRFGRLLNNSIELLESEGVHITKCRTADSRSYHATSIEPSQDEDE